MKLGEKILTLRKKMGLSQEQLGELVNVTRQTISNWELGETSPNPEQLKLLSKAFKISIDELLDNEIKSILEEKVSNTEKLAGIIIKILKVMGILAILYLIFFLLALLFIPVYRNRTHTVMEVEMQCSLEDREYEIRLTSDGSFQCLDCPIELEQELKNHSVDATDFAETENNIHDYFQTHGGSCK